MRPVVLAILSSCMALWFSGCSVSGQAIVLLSKPVPTATRTTTPPPTLTPAPAPTATPTPNFSGAIVRLQDLPPGFELVSAADLAKFNFSETTIAASFSQFAAETRPKNLFVFLKANPKLELVAGFTLYPLSASDRAMLDSSLSNPDALLQALATGFSVGGRTIKSSSAIPGMDKFGDRSVGITALPSMESGQLRMDAVVTRRGSVAQIVCLIFSDASRPSVAVGQIAGILDSRVASVLVK